MIKGDLAVWWITNPPAEPTWTPVASPKEGYELITREANRQLQDATIHSNAMGLCAWDGEDWEDWCDDEGDDLNAWAAKQGLD